MLDGFLMILVITRVIVMVQQSLLMKIKFSKKSKGFVGRLFEQLNGYQD